MHSAAKNLTDRTPEPVQKVFSSLAGPSRVFFNLQASFAHTCTANIQTNKAIEGLFCCALPLQTGPKPPLPMTSYSPRTANFFADVYEVVKLIPRGRVTSYGAIAAYLGAKGSSRMVGWAMNASHALPDVPAHRVVNRNGLLTGRHHFADPGQMQQLLEQEGVEVRHNQVVGFSDLFWDPATGLL